MGYILFSIILLIWAFSLVAKQKDFSLQVLYFIFLISFAIFSAFLKLILFLTPILKKQEKIRNI